GSAAVTVTSISCERHDGDDRRTWCRQGDELQPLRVERGRSGRRSAYRFPLPLAGPARNEPALVKVVAEDQHGRRVTGWAELTPDPLHADARLATRDDSTRRR
ncbi:MAG: hypothetical protein ACREIV_10665, partial [Planctomycetaceae bacterium]